MIDFQITTILDSPESQSIVTNLVQFNDGFVGKSGYLGLNIVGKNSKHEIVCGLRGFSNWNWLFIGHLWVKEGYRIGGTGTTLMKMAEREAIARKCEYVHLDTFSFQALDFYKKIGYEVFGTLEDYPKGHQRYYLKKCLG